MSLHGCFPEGSVSRLDFSQVTPEVVAAVHRVFRDETKENEEDTAGRTVSPALSLADRLRHAVGTDVSLCRATMLSRVVEDTIGTHAAAWASTDFLDEAMALDVDWHTRKLVYMTHRYFVLRESRSIFAGAEAAHDVYNMNAAHYAVVPATYHDLCRIMFRVKFEPDVFVRNTSVPDMKKIREDKLLALMFGRSDGFESPPGHAFRSSMFCHGCARTVRGDKMDIFACAFLGNMQLLESAVRAARTHLSVHR